MNALAPALDHARAFLVALDPAAGAFTFQTFDDKKQLVERIGRNGKPEKYDPLAKIVHGPLELAAAQLTALSQQGAGVYVCVNETDLRGRKEANVKRVRALFADLDGVPLANLERFRLEASIITVSSPGKFHCYWPVAGVALDEFKTLQKRLARLLDSDPSIHDLPRVLRLPGFLHQKVEPFAVTAHYGERRVYSRDEIMAALDEAERLLGLPPLAKAGDAEPGAPKPSGSVVDGLRGSFMPPRPEIDSARLADALARHWPAEGARHSGALVVGGFLARQGLAAEDIALVVEMAAEAAGDEEAEDRVTAAASAVEKLMRGEEIAGYPRLIKVFGEACAKELCEVLGTAPGGEKYAPAPPIEAACNVDATRFRWTDAGNALLFVALFKQDIRYVEAWRAWLIWDGQRWVEASDTAMLPLARAATERMFADAAQISDEEARTRLRKHALASQKEQRLRAMLNLAKGEAEIRIEPDRLDADPMLLGCRNGTLDLAKGELRAARREDFITKSIAVAYDAAAQCPNWLGFLRKIFPDDAETVEHLQRIAGYTLTGDVREEKLFPFFGGGDNGKSTFSETFIALLGDYAMKGSRDLLLERQGKGGAASPDVAALKGRRLVVVSETNDDCALDEAQVKATTSNARIPARRLHKDPFDFMPTHKTWLDTNHRPFVKGTDDGIWRRLNIVDFAAKIAEGEKIKDYRETRLMPEGAGILRWAVEGCRKWLCSGLKPSYAVKQTAAAYRSDMDCVGQWVEERCECDPKKFEAQKPEEKGFTSKKAAYSDYAHWTEAERLPTLGPRKFGDELVSRGFSRDKIGGVRGFKGFELRPFTSETLIADFLAEKERRRRRGE